MNRLPTPRYKDLALLKSVAEHQGLGSYPHIADNISAIRSAYALYRQRKGNALEITAAGIPNNVKGFLKGHYASPPPSLTHIGDMRLGHAHKTCPMCGSMGCGTLDHVLPKANHPEFSILSLNLAPACDCNRKRGTHFKRVPGERVLHPYYDACLSERLIRANFEDLGLIPKVTLALMVPSTHPDYAAVAFHVEQVVLKMPVNAYLSERWIAFCRQPNLVVRDLKQNPPSLDKLKETLKEERDLQDVSRGSKNNWDSAFISGLLETNVLNWLMARFQNPARQPNGPLV